MSLSFLDPTNQSVARCDRSIEAYSVNNGFDYKRFSSYLEFKNRKERQGRLNSVRAGEKVSGLEYYTDEVLVQELFGVYGKMDTIGARFSKIFANYKEERLEELAEWIVQEKDIDNIWNYEDDEEAFDISVHFGKEEIELFSSVHAGNHSGAERFVLPREQMKKADGKKFLVHCEQENAINLAQFDPQLELPPNCLSFNEKTNTFSQALAAQLQVFMHKHPFGITPTQLELNFSKCISDILYQKDIVWPQETKNGFILYPTYLEGHFSTPMQFFWKIYHQFRIILSLSHGIVKLSDAIFLQKKIFGFELNDGLIRCWGFRNTDEFVTFLFEHWCHSSIKLLSMGDLIPARSTSTQLIKKPGLYMVNLTDEVRMMLGKGKSTAQSLSMNFPNTGMMSNERGGIDWTMKFGGIELVQMISNEIDLVREDGDLDSRENQLSDGGIPFNCVKGIQRNAQILDEARDLPRRKYISCKLTYFLHPSMFYVILDKNASDLEKFQLRLKETYERKSESSKLRTSNAKLFKRGLLVVVQESDDSEFYRAIYLEKIDTYTHLLRSIDFGYAFHVPLERIWFLLHSFDCFVLAAQAIPCQLFNVVERSEWDKRVIERCCELLQPTDSKGNACQIMVSFQEQTANLRGQPSFQVRATGANQVDVGCELNGYMKTLGIKTTYDARTTDGDKTNKRETAKTESNRNYQPQANAQKPSSSTYQQPPRPTGQIPRQPWSKPLPAPTSVASGAVRMQHAQNIRPQHVQYIRPQHAQNFRPQHVQNMRPQHVESNQNTSWATVATRNMNKYRPPGAGPGGNKSFLNKDDFPAL